MKYLFACLYLFFSSAAFSQSLSQTNSSAPNQIGLSNNVDYSTHTTYNYTIDSKKMYAILDTIIQKLNAYGQNQKIDYNAFAKSVKGFIDKKDDVQLSNLLEEFKERFKKIPGSEKELAEISALQAVNDWNNMRFSKALDNFEEALKNDHFNIDYAIYKANLLQTCFGQSSKAIKFLQRFTTIVSDDSSKAKLYYNLSGLYYSSNDLDNALKYLNDAYNISKSNNFFSNKYAQSNLYGSYGMLYEKKNDEQNALRYYHLALDYYKYYSKQDYSWYSFINQRIGSYYLFRKNIDSSRTYLLEALKISLKDNSVNWSDLYQSLGQFYNLTNERANAELFYKYAYEQLEKEKGKMKIACKAKLQNNIAYDYLLSGNSAKANEVARLSIADLEYYPEFRQHPNLIFAYRIAADAIGGFEKPPYKDILEIERKNLDVMEQLEWQDFPYDFTLRTAGLVAILTHDEVQGLGYLQKTTFGGLPYKEKAVNLNTMGVQFANNGYCSEAITLYNLASYFISQTPDFRNDLYQYIIDQNLAMSYHDSYDYKNENYYFDLIHQGFKNMSKKDVDKFKKDETTIKKNHHRCR